MDFSAVPRQKVEAQFEFDLDFADHVAQDLWVDVTSFGTTFTPHSNNIVFPDILRIKVDVTSRPGIQVDAAQGMFTTQSSCFLSDGVADMYTTELTAKAAARALGQERSGATTSTSIPAYSVKTQRTGAVNLSVIDSNNTVLDEDYTGVNPPFLPVASSSDTTLARVLMNACKLVSMMGGHPNTNGDFVAKATVTVWYARQVRESISAAAEVVGSDNILAPSYPIVLSRSEISRIKSKHLRDWAMKAWLSGFDVAGPRLSVKQFFQHVVGFVKTASPFIIQGLSMLKEFEDDDDQDFSLEAIDEGFEFMVADPLSGYGLHHATTIINPPQSKRKGSNRRRSNKQRSNKPGPAPAAQRRHQRHPRSK